LLSGLFAYSQSPKDIIVNRLSDYQLRLQMVVQSMNASEIKINSLSTTISDLKQQLIDSQNKSQTTIDELNSQLIESEKNLKTSRKDLAEQKSNYATLSKDLDKLKISYNLSRSAKTIFVWIALGEGAYIVFDKLLLPLIKK
jgi:chromosome segregation ATPase